jgi:DSF synthase
MQSAYDRPLAPARYRNLVTQDDCEGDALWFAMDVRPRPCFTWDLIRDILSFQDSFANGVSTNRPRCLVFASATSGIFSLGGDLSLFQTVIERQDRTMLRQYARDCVTVLHNHLYARDVVTVSVLEGDALGAGLESALSSDVVIAERGVNAGFPEVLFNLVPGHGALFLVARRIGMRAAERMIHDGNVYTAEQLYEMGLIDVLVEKGEGRAAVRELLTSQRKSWNAFHSLQQIKRLHQPVSHEALSASAEIWVDAAMRLSKRDLRMMERLVRAQERRIGQPAGDTAAEPNRLPSPVGAVMPVLAALSA